MLLKMHQFEYKNLQTEFLPQAQIIEPSFL